jgi:hypothetical protein
MKILLYQDETVNLNLKALCEGLNRITDDDFDVDIGHSAFKLKPGSIKHPISHKGVSAQLAEEIRGWDLVLIITAIPYENNYFYEDEGNVIILSFYAWSYLTSLPMENGLVFFLAGMLRYNLPVPESHDLTTGCLNDFLWDKSAIDLGMRSAGLCSSCQDYLQKQKVSASASTSLRAIQTMLDPLGYASRANENILNYLTLASPAKAQDSPDRFHVFLCHNSKDKPAVRRVARSLETRKIRPWLDEDQLRPGLAWQVALEDQIAQIDSAVVFVGSSGFGPWQEMEVRSFLSEFVKRKCPVIPTILPEAENVPELPIFLRQMMWVDFREDAQRALELLIWGITGKKPTRRNVRN